MQAVVMPPTMIIASLFFLGAIRPYRRLAAETDAAPVQPA